MTTPQLINFPQASDIACREIDRNRSCHSKISNVTYILGDTPSQFTIEIAVTKAARKRGSLGRALAEFTRNQWYGVLLEKPSLLWGKPSTEYIFTMNPTYQKEIEHNIERYRYEQLLNRISDWNAQTLPSNIKASDVLTQYLGWGVRGSLDTIVKKALYDTVSKCSDINEVIMTTFAYYQALPNETLKLNTAIKGLMTDNIGQLYGQINYVFGSPQQPPRIHLEDAIIQALT